MPRRTSPLIRPLRAYGRRAGATLHTTVVLGGEQLRVHSFDGMSRAMRELVSELTTADPLERRAVLGVLIRLAQRMQHKRAPHRAPVVVGPSRLSVPMASRFLKPCSAVNSRSCPLARSVASAIRMAS